MPKKDAIAARGLLAWGPVLAVTALLAGCVQDPPFHEDEDLNQLVEAYRRSTAEAAADLARRESAAVRHLAIETLPDGRTRVSADLVGASVERAVTEILAQSGASYNLANVRLAGRVTARFSDLPLEQALNEIINPQGISVALNAGLLKFQNSAPLIPPTAESLAGDGSDGNGSGQTVYREVMLNYLDTADALALLSGLFSDDDDDSDDPAPGLQFGALDELNALFLTGPPELVAGALSILNRSDREVPHTLIEALVVDIDSVAAAQIGGRLDNFETGTWTGVSILPSAASNNISWTFAQALGNPLSVTASVDLLVSQAKAQVLSRSYIAARSRQQATLEIVEEQFVTIQVAEGGATLTTADGISAGVTLAITPSVMADGRIRLDLKLEDSHFIPVGGETLVAKDRSTATTSLTVNNGQTIAIGGLKSKLVASENTGLPWLRRMPLLNIFAGDQRGRDTRREIVLYLTPYIWTPNMDVPLVRQDIPAVESDVFTRYELPEAPGITAPR